MLIRKKWFDIVVLDDGFQHYRIINNLSIVCFNETINSNGFMIPAGPFRNLKRANNFTMETKYLLNKNS